MVAISRLLTGFAADDPGVLHIRPAGKCRCSLAAGARLILLLAARIARPAVANRLAFVIAALQLTVTENRTRRALLVGWAAFSRADMATRFRSATLRVARKISATLQLTALRPAAARLRYQFRAGRTVSFVAPLPTAVHTAAQQFLARIQTRRHLDLRTAEISVLCSAARTRSWPCLRTHSAVAFPVTRLLAAVITAIQLAPARFAAPPDARLTADLPCLVRAVAFATALLTAWRTGSCMAFLAAVVQSALQALATGGAARPLFLRAATYRGGLRTEARSLDGLRTRGTCARMAEQGATVTAFRP